MELLKEKKRFAYRLILICGVLPSLLGLFVILGWLLHRDSWVQIFPGFAPMQFNTALAFVSAGLAFIAVLKNRPKWVFALSVFPILVAILTLCQYCFDLNLGIDQLLVKGYISVKTSHPGRMAPNTALCFLLIGIALNLFRRTQKGEYRQFACVLISALVFILAVAGALGCFLSISDAYSWLGFTAMALHTSIGFIFLSSATYFSASFRASEQAKTTATATATATAAAAGIIVTTMFLCQVFISQNSKQVNQAVALEAEKIGSEVRFQMDSRFRALGRMASRLSVAGNYTTKENWQGDANLYTMDFPGLQEISWLDAAYRIKWVWPKNGSDTRLNSELSAAHDSQLALPRTMADRKIIWNSRVSLSSGVAGFVVYQPIIHSGHLGGFIGAAFDYQKLLDAILSDVLSENFAIALFNKNERIYVGTGEENDRVFHEVAIDLPGGGIWKLRLAPTKGHLNQFRSRIPIGILVLGLIVAFAVSFLFFFAEKIISQTKELALANEKFAAFFSNVKDYAFITLDPQGRIASWNAGAEQIKGYKSEEVLGKHFSIFYPKDEIGIGQPEKALRLAREAGEYESSGIRVKRDGSTFWANILITCIKDAEGKVIGFCKITRDTSAQRVAELSLRLKEEIIRSMSEGVYIVDSNQIIRYANPAMEKMLGFSEGDLIGKSIAEITKLDQNGINEKAQEVRACNDKGIAWHGEVEKIRKDGSTFWVSASCALLDHPDYGKVWISVQKDISEWKRYEMELTASKQRFQSALEAAPAAMVMVDANGRIVLANRQTESLFGYQREELLGKQIEILIPERFKVSHPVQRSAYMEHPESRAMGSGRQLHGVRKNGTEFPIEIGLNPMRTQDGIFVMSSIADITDRKIAEEKLLIQKAELERSNADLEQFAYVASHDLQEPLRAVTNNCQALDEKYHNKLEPGDIEYLELAVSGAKRMQGLVEGLLAYSRVNRENAEGSHFDGNEALQEVFQNLKDKIEGEGVELTADPMPILQGNKLQFTQILQNLIVNAIKFRGKAIPSIHIGVSPSDSQLPVFYVRDNGIGIDKKHFSRIFVIFQRLHGRNKYPGTGLGLAICKKIVERYGGEIWVESKLGEGSVFYFKMFRKYEESIPLREAA